MGNPLALFKPEALINELTTMNVALKDSYSQAKHQIQEGVNFFKEEVTDICDKAGNYLHRIALPINNFLKDLSQIDCELKLEIYRDSFRAETVQNGTMPQQAHPSMGEENY
jgi:hypothetical protein